MYKVLALKNSKVKKKKKSQVIKKKIYKVNGLEMIFHIMIRIFFQVLDSAK